MPGPLSGLRIVEFAGIGPGPFAAMMFADHGAEVIRIERRGGHNLPGDTLSRSRRSILLDTKSPEGRDIARALCRRADALLEGFRPGVMERLGLGPEVLLADNPKLVYGRMTGWGQTGPLAQAAGHDINYIALSGLLDTVGERGGKPVVPVNYLGDFGGGAMMLAFGMLAALLHVRAGGPGQVVDAAMTDGSALLGALTWTLRHGGLWSDTRGSNLLDGGAPFYDTYVCKDGRHIAVGAIEPQFYALLRQKAGLDDPAFDAQMDRERWPEMKARCAAIFLTRTREEWCALLEGSDACVSPVLSLAEAPHHPHNAARGSFTAVGGLTQPAPAPRYSQTPPDTPAPAVRPGADTDAILAELGLAPEAIADLRRSGVAG